VLVQVIWCCNDRPINRRGFVNLICVTHWAELLNQYIPDDLDSVRPLLRYPSRDRI
jgi:hypothetical protein